MSDKNRINANMENDDMNIKSHLNTSLELDKISVSEDLINRTLDAIKKQSAEEGSKTAEAPGKESEQKKVSHLNRYVRGIAGIAAAGLVIFLGYSLIQNFPGMIGSKKNSEAPNYRYSKTGGITDECEPAKDYTSSTADTGVNQAAGEEKKDTAASEQQQDSQTKMDSAESGEASDMAGAASTSAADGTSENQQDNSGVSIQSTFGEVPEADTAGTGGESKEAFTGVQALTFRMVCVLTPEELSAVKITGKDKKGGTVTLSDPDSIKSFYAIMDQYTFTPTQVSSEDRDYTVYLEEQKPNGAIYTVSLGENVAVSSTDGDDVRVYTASNYTALKKDMDSFLKEYSR